jgi:hypothetical protein
MLKKVTLLAALNISFLIGHDTSKDDIVWQNNIGKFENASIIYYAIKNDEYWMTQYVKYLDDNSFGARSVSTNGMCLGVRLSPHVVKGHFEQYEKQFNEHAKK